LDARVHQARVDLEKHGGIILSNPKARPRAIGRANASPWTEYVRNVQRVRGSLQEGPHLSRQAYGELCPATQTALSDEEVEMESQRDFYYFKVEVVM
jgi:hypothetical protein